MAITSRKAQGLAEHSVGTSTVRKVARNFAEAGWTTEWGGTMRNRRAQTGGVAMAVRSPGRTIKHSPKSIEMQLAEQMGRAAIYCADCQGLAKMGTIRDIQAIRHKQWAIMVHPVQMGYR